MRPSRPYETRSSSSTCAGRPLPRRPATYFTSGAYVTIKRSRMAGSPLARYSRHRACMSSGLLTAREYGVGWRNPLGAEGGERERAHPGGDRRGRDGDDPAARAVPGGRDGDEQERGGEHGEEDSEPPALHRTTVLSARPRGVAQLVERRSPKP